jgi:hypothetical protein
MIRYKNILQELLNSLKVTMNTKNLVLLAVFTMSKIQCINAQQALGINSHNSLPEIPASLLQEPVTSSPEYTREILEETTPKMYTPVQRIAGGALALTSAYIIYAIATNNSVWNSQTQEYENSYLTPLKFPILFNFINIAYVPPFLMGLKVLLNK